MALRAATVVLRREVGNTAMSEYILLLAHKTESILNPYLDAFWDDVIEMEFLPTQLQYFPGEQHRIDEYIVKMVLEDFEKSRPVNTVRYERIKEYLLESSKTYAEKLKEVNRFLGQIFYFSCLVNDLLFDSYFR